MILRPYQDTAILNLRQRFMAGLRRLILKAATGAGKTEIAMAMIRGARERGKRCLFVVNRIELVGQASRRFHAAGIDHGMIQGSNTWRTDSPVLVASIQTLAKRGWPEIDFAVIDEAHGCAGSQAYRDMLIHYKGVPMVGLTATPYSRGLGKEYPELGPLFQGVVEGPTYRELTDDGFLVDVDVYSTSEPDLSGVKITAGDYNEKELNTRVDKVELIGDIVATWKRLAGDKQTICFATSIAHSEHIVQQFNAAGVTAEHIDCYTPEEDRRGVLNRLANGNTRVVSNCAILAEGFDSPCVEVMILARPTKSRIRFIQMGGRVLRPAPGKTEALLLDHSGTCKRMGFPNDDHDIELDDGKPRQSKAEEKDEPLPKECPACHYLKPAKVHKCPACGFEPAKRSDVATKAGELEKMERKKRTPMKEVSTEEKRQIYAELLGYAKQRGYKDGWAYFACRDLFGSAVQSKRGAVAPVKPSFETEQLVQHLNIRRANQRAAA